MGLGVGHAILGRPSVRTARRPVPTIMRWILVQSQRLDGCFVNCSCDWQAVITLEIRHGRSQVNAQRSRYFSVIISCILQSSLDVCDHFVRKQIAVGVDWPVIVVITIKGIVTKSWIPIAPVQEIISGGNKDDGVTMIMQPVAVVPFVPVTTKGFVEANTILFIVSFFIVPVL